MDNIILQVGALFLGSMLMLFAITYVAVPTAMSATFQMANQSAAAFGVNMDDFEVQSVEAGMSNFALMGVAVPIIGLAMILQHLIREKQKEEREMMYHETDNPFNTGPRGDTPPFVGSYP